MNTLSFLSYQFFVRLFLARCEQFMSLPRKYREPLQHRMGVLSLIDYSFHVTTGEWWTPIL